MTARAFDTEDDVSASKPGAFSFTVPRSALSEALGRVKAPSGGSLPILACVLLSIVDGVVTLETTNLDQRVVTTLIGVVATGTGCAAIPLKRFSEVVSGFIAASPITVTVSGRKARLTCGRAKVDLVCMDPEEWPVGNSWRPGTASATMDGRVLASAFARVRGHVSDKESRPTLNGVLLEGVADGFFVVATDGYTLMAVRVSDEAPFRGEWIVPSSTVSILAHLFGREESISVVEGAGYLRIVGPSATLTSRLIEGPYPPYRQVLARPSVAFSSIADRATLLRAVKAAAALAANDERRILLQFRAESIDVSSEYADIGRSDDAIVAARTVLAPSGKEFTNYIGFNASHLQASLESFACDDVRLIYQGAERALHVEDAAAPIDTHTRGLAMGMRILDVTASVVDGVEVANA